MTMKKEIVSIIDVTVVFLAIIVISVMVAMAIVKASRTIVEARQPKVYQIDTAKVRVLYEDTWGKILFVKEEDL